MVIKRIFAFLALPLLFLSQLTFTESENMALMTGKKLQDLITGIDKEATVSGSVIEFKYDDTLLVCIYDENADRMRIISPIAELTEVSSEQLVIAMAANFHTALDARYAISEGVVYSVYVHPLSPLTENQLHSAVRQVASARNTFGSLYSSGELSFPGSKKPARQGKQPKVKT